MEPPLSYSRGPKSLKHPFVPDTTEINTGEPTHSPVYNSECRKLLKVSSIPNATQRHDVDMSGWIQGPLVKNNRFRNGGIALPSLRDLDFSPIPDYITTFGPRLEDNSLCIAPVRWGINALPDAFCINIPPKTPFPTIPPAQSPPPYFSSTANKVAQEVWEAGTNSRLLQGLITIENKFQEKVVKTRPHFSSLTIPYPASAETRGLSEALEMLERNSMETQCVLQSLLLWIEQRIHLEAHIL